MPYNGFDEVAAGQMTENAPGGVGDQYTRPAVQPPTFSATVGDDPTQKQDPQWGWAEQRKWNAEVNRKLTTLATKEEMQQGFDKLAASIAEVKQMVTPPQ